MDEISEHNYTSFLILERRSRKTHQVSQEKEEKITQTSLGKDQNRRAELMIMGFVSLLLTIGDDLIVKMCFTPYVGNSFLPCKHALFSRQSSVSDDDHVTKSKSMLRIESADGVSYCEANGMISLLSHEGIEQLHLFIFVLAVFHVLYCVLTMSLGIAKMRTWKSWEEDMRTLQYKLANDPRHRLDDAI